MKLCYYLTIADGEAERVNDIPKATEEVSSKAGIRIWGERKYYYPHFTGAELRHKELSVLSNVTKDVCGRTGNGSQVF